MKTFFLVILISIGSQLLGVSAQNTQSEKIPPVREQRFNHSETVVMEKSSKDDSKFGAVAQKELSKNEASVIQISSTLRPETSQGTPPYSEKPSKLGSSVVLDLKEAKVSKANLAKDNSSVAKNPSNEK